MKKTKSIQIIQKRRIYFAVSGAVLVAGLISFLLYGLNFSIEFTGGSRFKLESKSLEKLNEGIQYAAEKDNLEIVSKTEEAQSVTFRVQTIDQKVHDQVLKNIKEKDPSVLEQSFETVGPVIGGETQNNAIKAVILAIIAITIYVAFVFRAVSRPVSSWKFGVVTIITLAHDILITVGIFSILGKVFGVETDTLFITALLTILGFSVHDTIVVFDRIREHLKRNDAGISFEQLVNSSVIETINRSFNTSVTVVYVLFALLLFSHGSLFWFVVALLIGIVSGTYSSIFIASPLLVEWAEFDKKRNAKKASK